MDDYTIGYKIHNDDYINMHSCKKMTGNLKTEMKKISLGW